MLDIAKIVSLLKPAKNVLFQKYRLKEMAVFGSASRGDSTDASDIDILVDYEGKMGLEFIDLAEELEAILHARVDLVSKQAIKPKLLSRIEPELVYV